MHLSPLLFVDRGGLWSISETSDQELARHYSSLQPPRWLKVCFHCGVPSTMQGCSALVMELEKQDCGHRPTRFKGSSADGGIGKVNTCPQSKINVQKGPSPR